MMTLFTRVVSLCNLLIIRTSIRRYSRACFVLTLPRTLSNCFLSESRTSRSKCCGPVICQERSLHSSKSAEMAVRAFEDKTHAELYARYRPTYPEGVPRTIVDYFKSGKGANCNFELAVDVGCGNEQSSRLLCSYFRQVIGLDVSTEQIASAQKDVDNLSFRVGPGEDLSFLQDNSVDVVTIAQALHWLDRDVFYKEVKRVLKLGGVFAVYGYSQHILDDAEANKYMTERLFKMVATHKNTQPRASQLHAIKPTSPWTKTISELQSYGWREVYSTGSTQEKHTLFRGQLPLLEGGQNSRGRGVAEYLRSDIADDSQKDYEFSDIESISIEFYADFLGPYWERGRRHVDNHYKDMDHPFAGWERIENDNISIKRTMSVDAYIGYLSSTSSWQTYLKKDPYSDALEQLKKRIKSIYQAKPGKENSDLNVYWPVFMLIGRKPN